MKKAVFVVGTLDYRATRKGDAFLDVTLDMLDRIATRAGVDASLVVAIEDPMHAGKGKQKLGIKRIREQQGRVLDEITQAKPDFVMCFGPVASACVWGKGNLVEGEMVRQAHHPMGEAFAPVFVTYSLENVRYSAGMVKWLELDMQSAAHGWSEPQLGDYDVLLPGTTEWGVRPDWLTIPDNIVGWDLETFPGFSPWHPEARIRMGMLSDRKARAVVVQATPESGFPQWYLDILADPTIEKRGSNIKFDVRWSRRYGQEVENFMCTSTTEHIIDESNPKKDLKSLTFTYYPELGDYSKGHRMLVKERGGWEFVRDDEQYDYAGGDADTSYVTARGQDDIVRQRGLEQPYKIMRDLYPVLANMEIRGSCLDVDMNRHLDKLYSEKLAALREKITEHLGPINPNSTPQLAEALRKAAPTIRLTKRMWTRVLGDEESNEEVSTARAVLERESHKHASIPFVLEFRKYRTRHSTFIKGVYEKHKVQHGGSGLWYVHPTYRTDLVSTYRLSSQGPNDQNAPRKDKDDPELTIKKQVVSRFKGGKIIDVDQSQVEIRMAAYLSQDPKMLAAIASGEDIHYSMAAIMLEKLVPPEGEEDTCDPDIYVTDDERTECKARTFLILFGGGAKKLAQDLGISNRAGQVLIDEYFATFTGLRDYIDKTHAMVREDLSVTTLWGFVRRFVAPPEHWDSPDGWSVQRQAFNTKVQNGAVVLTYLAMIYFDAECARRGLQSMLIKQVHDSMVIDTHPDEVDEVATLAKFSMENAGKMAEQYGVKGLDLPLVSSVEIGDNWGSMETWAAAA